MDNQELAEIDAAARAIVRRAYELGRSEALKRVAQVLDAERSANDQLALAPPEPAVQEPDANMNGADTSYTAPTSGKPPWWAWRVR